MGWGGREGPPKGPYKGVFLPPSKLLPLSPYEYENNRGAVMVQW